MGISCRKGDFILSQSHHQATTIVTPTSILRGLTYWLQRKLDFRIAWRLPIQVESLQAWSVMSEAENELALLLVQVYTTQSHACLGDCRLLPVKLRLCTDHIHPAPPQSSVFGCLSPAEGLEWDWSCCSRHIKHGNLHRVSVSVAFFRTLSGLHCLCCPGISTAVLSRALN